VECASGASLSYQDLRHGLTETTPQQRVAAVGHAVIERAVSEWHQCLYTLTFVMEADILSTCDVQCNVILRWYDVTRVTFETITASCACCYHSNVHLIVTLTAQSDTLEFPRCCKHIV